MLAVGCRELGARHPSKVADEDLWVRDARQGDEAAVLRLVGRYRPALCRLLDGICGDAALAEDLAQDSLLHALSHLGDLRDPAMFYPWLRKSAVRRALRALRGRRETRPLEEAPLHLADPASATDIRLHVHTLLAGLPAHLRAVLMLRELEELDYRDIAGVLQIPVGTVRSRLFTARERFKCLYLEAEREGGPPDESRT